MGVIAAYRRVLGNGNLSRLLFGEFVSSIGDWLYLVALLVLIWEATKDPVTLGIIGAARIVPYILLSIPAGIAADRFDRRKILLLTDIVRGVIMLLMAGAVYLNLSIWVIVGLAITATCFSSFFSPAIGAYLPSLTRDESELGPANSAWSSLTNLAYFIGPAFAALLLSTGSLIVAFLLNAVTFAVVAVVLLGLPSHKAGDKAAASVDVPASVKPVGLLATLRPVTRPMLGLTVLNIVVGFVSGGLGVISVLLSVEVFKIDEATGTGLLNAAIGVGGVVGAVFAGGLVLRRRQGPPLLIGAIAMGLGLALVGQVPDFTFALFAIGLAAAGSLLIEIVMTTLLQRIVPDTVRGRALGLIETGFVLFYAAGAFVIPVVASGQVGLVLLASGAAIALSGAAGLALLGSYAIQQPADDPRQRLAKVPLFGGLPPARLETAMRRATMRDVKSGTTIIRQGDPADFFYVINSGRVEVTQTDGSGPSRLLRQMGPGEFFGEIGLLSRIPRTATVVAMTDCTLVALEGAAFLELVETGPGLTSMLLDVHRGAVSAAGDAS
ncbi:MAG TPA: MFS transporter [Candidatus Limnocylindria bacterium]|nr:MFS transporter [Candidatus Limnocylindria bacterium]